MAHAFQTVREEAKARSTAISDLIDQVKTDVLDLVHNEIALLKAELIPQAKYGGVGVGLFGGAVYFIINAMLMLFIAAGLGLGTFFDAPSGGFALGFLILGIVMFVVAGGMAVIGFLAVKQVKGPKRTIAHAQASIETVKEMVTRSDADARTQALERRAFRKSNELG